MNEKVITKQRSQEGGKLDPKQRSQEGGKRSKEATLDCDPERAPAGLNIATD
jgi:hypothetical protein